MFSKLYYLKISVDNDDSGLEYYAVAVVRKDNAGFDVETLGEKKACHTGKFIGIFG